MFSSLDFLIKPKQIKDGQVSLFKPDLCIPLHIFRCEDSVASTGTEKKKKRKKKKSRTPVLCLVNISRVVQKAKLLENNLFCFGRTEQQFYGRANFA